MMLLRWLFDKHCHHAKEETRYALELAKAAEEHAREVERANEISARLQLLDTQTRSFIRLIKQDR